MRFVNAVQTGHSTPMPFPVSTPQHNHITTQVQATLTSAQFKQLIHAPGAGPPGPPPGPVPHFYTVSGAGSPVWNGQYVRAASGGDREGLVFQSTSCASCSLYAYDGAWRLAISGKELFYTNGSPAALPPTSGWEPADGKAPAPALTAGPTATVRQSE